MGQRGGAGAEDGGDVTAGKADLALGPMFPLGCSGQMARPLSWLLSQGPGSTCLCKANSYREPQSGAAGTHARHPTFIAVGAQVQGDTVSKQGCGEQPGLLPGPGQAHTSPGSGPQRPPPWLPFLPSYPLYTASKGVFLQANVVTPPSVKIDPSLAPCGPQDKALLKGPLWPLHWPVAPLGPGLSAQMLSFHPPHNPVSHPILQTT